MLLLNPKAETVWCTHPESGARFLIRPVPPEKYDEIRRKSLRSDKTLDISKWGEQYALEAIADWEGVGDAGALVDCTPEHRRTFGRNQAILIMPWVIDQSTSLDMYRQEEEAAAKNA